MLPDPSNANPVGRYSSANLISENPGGTSAPSSSTVEGGIVGTSVSVSVIEVVSSGGEVSVGDKVFVRVGAGDVTVDFAG